ncbi:MAG: DUF3489 domain-containing protein [Alphaproteobacteria bacterium]|nr:DUF3489 domain-containing protein [Alphaproteobacteria bacterium]
MKKLSKTQTLILSRASQQADRIALPLPDHLSGAAARTVVRLLLEKHLLDEVDANLRKNDPMWRETGDGHGTTLVITGAGLEAIGLEVPTRLPDPEPAKPKQRTGTKQALLIAMLRAPDGATIAEIVTALEWQPHTARGAISGALKKRLGLTIASEKIDGRGRVYHIED